MRRKSLLCAATVLCTVAAAAAVLCIIHKWENKESTEESYSYEDEGRAEFYYRDGWYAQDPDKETLLLVGVDKYSEELAASLQMGKETDKNINTQQADFLLLLILDKQKNVCQVLPLNRDTMTPITALGTSGEVIGTFEGQLALAHTYGDGGMDSGYNTVQAVSDLLYGVEIEHFITVTMDAVPLLNDMVGGVTVKVEDDFSAVTDQLPQGQEIRLMGPLALTFVRARHDVADETNISRMTRQKTYLEAFYRQLKEKQAAQERFTLDALLELSGYMVSDCSVTALNELCQEILDSRLEVLEAPEGESVKGERYMEFYPDRQKLQDTVIDLLFERVE